ncbi:MAG: hypothetical protein ACJ8HU_04355 [Chthoniobacterales bacterium]
MKAISFVGALLALSVCAFSDEPRPYLGEWSNGRGETLTITANTIKFAESDAVQYRDVTHDSEDDTYELQITARGEINAFPGKTLVVACDKDSMEMTSYASHDAYVHEEEPLSVITWFRDKDETYDSDPPDE